MADELDELEMIRKQQVAELLKRPEEKERVLLETVLELRDSDRRAKTFCKDVCAPGFRRQIGRIQRFMWMVLGGGLVVGTVLTLLELFR